MAKSPKATDIDADAVRKLAELLELGKEGPVELTDQATMAVVAGAGNGLQ